MATSVSIAVHIFSPKIALATPTFALAPPVHTFISKGNVPNSKLCKTHVMREDSSETYACKTQKTIAQRMTFLIEIGTRHLSMRSSPQGCALWQCDNQLPLTSTCRISHWTLWSSGWRLLEVCSIARPDQGPVSLETCTIRRKRRFEYTLCKLPSWTLKMISAHAL